MAIELKYGNPGFLIGAGYAAGKNKYDNRQREFGHHIVMRQMQQRDELERQDRRFGQQQWLQGQNQNFELQRDQARDQTRIGEEQQRMNAAAFGRGEPLPFPNAGNDGGGGGQVIDMTPDERVHHRAMQISNDRAMRMGHPLPFPDVGDGDTFTFSGPTTTIQQPLVPQNADGGGLNSFQQRQKLQDQRSQTQIDIAEMNAQKAADRLAIEGVRKGTHEYSPDQQQQMTTIKGQLATIEADGNLDETQKSEARKKAEEKLLRIVPYPKSASEQLSPAEWLAQHKHVDENGDTWVPNGSGGYTIVPNAGGNQRKEQTKAEAEAKQKLKSSQVESDKMYSEAKKKVDERRKAEAGRLLKETKGDGVTPKYSVAEAYDMAEKAHQYPPEPESPMQPEGIQPTGESAVGVGQGVGVVPPAGQAGVAAPQQGKVAAAIQAARNGDQAAQHELEKRGIKWQQ
jgi:hypothetical protein